MRIGIVLAAVPGYSETFFRNKIHFLNETPGVDMILFVDQRTDSLEWNECPIVFGATIQGNVFFRSLYLIYLFIRVVLLHPIKALSLFIKNRTSGFGLVKNVKSLLQSSHILGSKLDWLHFGFGTMAVGRENLAQVIKARMAVSFRGFDHYVYPLKNTGCYEILFQCSNRFHVLSEAMKTDLINQGVSRDLIFVITPAIDATSFQFDSLNCFAEQLRITTVSRLHWIKGLEYTLEALALLVKKGVDFKYTIIGEGEERERLLFAAHQMGILDKVTLAGKLPPADVFEMLKKTDIYLQYSIQEGFCNAALEAQATGVLCIVSDVDGLKENIVHGQTGWVVPKRNPALLANKVLEIISMDDSERNEIKSNAINRVVSNFNLDLQKKLFLQFYEYES